MSGAGRAIEIFRGLVHGINAVFAWLAAAVVTALVGMISFEVIARYVFDAPTVWAMDYSSFALTFAFFFALGPALQSGHHVDVDLFDPLIPPRFRPAQRQVGALLTLLFGAVLLIYVTRIAHTTIVRNQTAFAMVVIPLKYVYWIGPVGVAQFVLTAALQVLEGQRWADDRAVEQAAG